MNSLNPDYHPRTVEALIEAVRQTKETPREVTAWAVMPTVALLFDICERIIALEKATHVEPTAVADAIADALQHKATEASGKRCVECDFAILPGQDWVQGQFGPLHALCDETAVM